MFLKIEYYNLMIMLSYILSYIPSILYLQNV